MHAPEKVHVANLADCEVLSRAMFQAGLRWPVVAAKWPGIRDALAGFDPDHPVPDFPAWAADRGWKSRAAT